ncbi:MAG: DedA family protein [Gordonia sp. (in: high G+C Gram-positive bacteria)]|uniref:DedA family protein n=1 Tax=Gordonia sp. (in: high G+C Gram-positive bacteria) TaxID=84139 RepID=UPI0039E3C17E
MNPFDVTGFLGTAGLVGLLVLLFVETGILVGFIFPGDSVLFTAGLFAAQPDPFAPLWLLLIALPIAAAAGDQCGYSIGKHFGPRVMRGRLARFIGDEPVAKTVEYFDRYGPVTVVFARFIGIVRTLVPLLAGLSGMNRLRFTAYSVVGSVFWCGSLVTAGYFLGGIAVLRENLELLFIGSALTVVVPMVITLARRRRAAARARSARLGSGPTCDDSSSSAPLPR